MPPVLRRDDAYLRRCRLAFPAIVCAMPVVLAAWALAAGGGFLAKVSPMLAWLAYSAAVAHFVCVRPLRHYRCPRCGRRLPGAEDARPWYRFRCSPCGVEWDVQRSGEGEGTG
jgi:hypothetical protein